ncbi:unnamed protein product, partial [Aphanomyces euteiches]
RTVLPYFSLGDFVLVAPHPPKLTSIWRGPKRITKVLSDWLFEVTDLVEPYSTSLHHASRLKFYADESRGVTDDMLG